MLRREMVRLAVLELLLRYWRLAVGARVHGRDRVVGVTSVLGNGVTEGVGDGGAVRDGS